MGVLTQAAVLFQGTANKNPQLQQRWIAASFRLGNIGAEEYLRYQFDYQLDMLLRAMEDELAGVDHENMPEATMLGMNVQSMLTRQWLFSTYEMLRTAKSSAKGQGNADLKSLHDDIKVIRVPLAKNEIADDRRLAAEGLELVRVGNENDVVVYDRVNKVPYHPSLQVNIQTGSFGWKAIDLRNGALEREFYRRDLSDRLLHVIETAPSAV